MHLQVRLSPRIDTKAFADEESVDNSKLAFIPSHAALLTASPDRATLHSSVAADAIATAGGVDGHVLNGDNPPPPSYQTSIAVSANSQPNHCR